MRDPTSRVRLWAVHALACDHCEDDVKCSIDVVPLLIERIELDENIRVRRMAAIMLSTEHIDQRAVPVLQRLLREEEVVNCNCTWSMAFADLLGAGIISSD